MDTTVFCAACNLECALYGHSQHITENRCPRGHYPSLLGSGLGAGMGWIGFSCTKIYIYIYINKNAQAGEQVLPSSMTQSIKIRTVVYIAMEYVR